MQCYVPSFNRLDLFLWYFAELCELEPNKTDYDAKKQNKTKRRDPAKRFSTNRGRSPDAQSPSSRPNYSLKLPFLGATVDTLVKCGRAVPLLTRWERTGNSTAPQSVPNLKRGWVKAGQSGVWTAEHLRAQGNLRARRRTEEGGTPHNSSALCSRVRTGARQSSVDVTFSGTNVDSEARRHAGACFLQRRDIRYSESVLKRS